MLARPARREDASGIDRLLSGGPHDVRIDRDVVFVTGPVGEPDGLLVYRPGAWVHELQCGKNRLRAESLENFAVAAALASGLRSAIFTVKKDNRAMQRFVESLGAVRQDEDTLLYVLNPE